VTYEELVDPRFDDLLRSSGMRAKRSDWLPASAETVVGLWPDMTIAYLNATWFRFARDNGASADFAEKWLLGSNLLDALPPVLKSHYRVSYEQCLEAREPLHVDYECSTPDRFRVFRSVAYPIGESAGLLVVHTPRVERTHDRPAAEPVLDRFVDANGLLTQCAYCRRYAEPGGVRRWLWVPDWVAEPPDVSVTHGICEPCVGFYFARPTEWPRRR